MPAGCIVSSILIVWVEPAAHRGEVLPQRRVSRDPMAGRDEQPTVGETAHDRHLSEVLRLVDLPGCRSITAKGRKHPDPDGVPRRSVSARRWAVNRAEGVGALTVGSR